MIDGMSEYSQHYDTAPAAALKPQQILILEEFVEAVAEVPLSSTLSCVTASECLTLSRTHQVS